MRTVFRDYIEVVREDGLVGLKLVHHFGTFKRHKPYHWVAGSAKSGYWPVDGPIWSTRLAHNRKRDTHYSPEQIGDFLKVFGTKKMVMGHVYTTDNKVTSIHDDRVVLTDTRISSAYDGKLTATKYDRNGNLEVIDNIQRPQGIHPLRKYFPSMATSGYAREFKLGRCGL